jgi:ABC-type antimicrobial peptide transport system permease subunit
MKSAGTVFDSEVWARRSVVGPLFGKETYTSVVVRAADGAAALKLRDYFRDDYAKSALEAFTEPEYFSSLGETNKQFLVGIVFVTVIMSIGGVMGVMNTMFAAISQRTRDIGVLRLLGYSRLRVVISFLVESVMIGLVGGGLGCLLGSLVNGTTATSIVSSGAGGKTIVLELKVDSTIIAVGLLFSLVMGVIGGLIPSVMRAVWLKPLEALR